jgi:hypothetical protein
MRSASIVFDFPALFSPISTPSGWQIGIGPSRFRKPVTFSAVTLIDYPLLAARRDPTSSELKRRHVESMDVEVAETALFTTSDASPQNTDAR